MSGEYILVSDDDDDDAPIVLYPPRKGKEKRIKIDDDDDAPIVLKAKALSVVTTYNALMSSGSSHYLSEYESETGDPKYQPWPVRMPMMVKKLRERGSDILLLNEVNRTMVNDITKNLGMSSVVGPSSEKQSLQCAVAWSHRYAAKGSAIYPDADRIRCIIQRLIRDDGCEVLVGAAHLKAGESQHDENIRATQIKTILATFAKTNPATACVFGGDLNSDPSFNWYKSQVVPMMLADGWTNVSGAKPTYLGDANNGWASKTPIKFDYIFVKNASAQDNVRVDTLTRSGPNAEQPSDHTPVTVALHFGKQTSRCHPSADKGKNKATSTSTPTPKPRRNEYEFDPEEIKQALAESLRHQGREYSNLGGAGAAAVAVSAAEALVSMPVRDIAEVMDGVESRRDAAAARGPPNARGLPRPNNAAYKIPKRGTYEFGGNNRVEYALLSKILSKCIIEDTNEAYMYYEIPLDYTEYYEGDNEANRLRLEAYVDVLREMTTHHNKPILFEISVPYHSIAGMYDASNGKDCIVTIFDSNGPADNLEVGDVNRHGAMVNDFRRKGCKVAAFQNRACNVGRSPRVTSKYDAEHDIRLNDRVGYCMVWSHAFIYEYAMDGGVQLEAVNRMTELDRIMYMRAFYYAFVQREPGLVTYNNFGKEEHIYKKHGLKPAAQKREDIKWEKTKTKQLPFYF
jgi:endonuclease/exonuclease/phosphatase family metal-dependent hydrolase